MYLKEEQAGVLMILASAAGFGTLPISIKFAYVAGANVITILTVRFLLAAVFLVLALKIRGIRFHIERKMAIKLCLLGAIGYGMMSMLYALSLRYLSASLGVMLLYSYPAIVSLISFAIGDEIFSWQKSLSLVVCFIGLTLVVGISLDGVQPIGILFGLGASIVYSCYIIISKRVLKNVESTVATAYVCLSAGICFLLIGASSGDLNINLSWEAWLSITGMALLATVIGVLGFFAGLSRIGASNASIISTLEPVITVLLSLLLLNEKLTIIQGIGGVVILAGIVILQMGTKTVSKASKRLHA